MADFDTSSLGCLAGALSVGSDIRKEIRKGPTGWKWVQRHPRAAWAIAAAIDLVVWPIALAVALGILVAVIGFTAAIVSSLSG